MLRFQPGKTQFHASLGKELMRIRIPSFKEYANEFYGLIALKLQDFFCWQSRRLSLKHEAGVRFGGTVLHINALRAH